MKRKMNERDPVKSMLDQAFPKMKKKQKKKEEKDRDED